MAQCAQCRAEIAVAGEACPRCGGAGAVVPDELLGRELLGRYRIVRLLAEGGMGRVYLGEQAVGTVVRRVAVKVLRRQLSDDRQLASRFAREAETLVRLTHPNTVQLFDFGALPDGTLALVMEYVEGHSLARELGRGPLPLPRVERMLAQICGALAEAHAHGIVHRDLKPDNLLIADRVGHGDFVKVLDFGIAKVSALEEASNVKLTQQGMIIGTPPYMSPEQFSAEAVDARSDVYSLGVIVFEMLTGKLPFAANTPWEWASKHLTADPEPLRTEATSTLAPHHATAVRRALAKRPEDRPQSVDEFLALFSGGRTASALTPAADDDSAPRPSTATGTGDGPLRPRLPARALAIGAVAGLALLGALYALQGRAPAPPAAEPAPRPAVARAAASRPPSLPVLPSGRTMPAAEPRPPAAQRADGDEPPPPATRTRRRERAASEPGSSGNTREPPGAAVSGAGPSERASVGGPDPAEEPGAHAAQPPEPTPAATRSPDARGSEPSPAPRKPPVAGSVPSHTAANSSAPTAVPPDLQQRIAQIEAAARGRLEVAVGLYQAAAGKHGSHPALQRLRPTLTKAAEPRLKELLSQKRCAQAQALQRALNAIQAAPSAKGLFGGPCAAP